MIGWAYLADAGGIPEIPGNVRWVKPLLIGIGILLAAAMVIGPILRARRPREVLDSQLKEPGVQEDGADQAAR